MDKLFEYTYPHAVSINRIPLLDFFVPITSYATVSRPEKVVLFVIRLKKKSVAAFIDTVRMKLKGRHVH